MKSVVVIQGLIIEPAVRLWRERGGEDQTRMRGLFRINTNFRVALKG
jgi:hypothetical protein